MTLFSAATGFLLLLRQHWVLTILFLFAARELKSRYLHPLSKIPGPFLASVSKLWIIYHAFGGNQHLVQIKCHEKYGPIFRAAPNYVIVNDPKYLNQIYRFNRADWFIAYVFFATSSSNLAGLILKSESLALGP
jgi:hypothetical protein